MLRLASLQSFFCSLALLYSTSSQGHPLDLGYFRLEADDTRAVLMADLELNPKTIEILGGLERHSLNRESLKSSEATITALILQKILIRSGASLCEWVDQRVIWVDETQIRFTARTDCTSPRSIRRSSTFEPESDLAFDFKFLDSAPPTFQILGKYLPAHSRDGERTFLIDKTNSSYTLPRSEEFNPHFLQFIAMGIKHIGAAPSEWKNEKGLHLPDGIDHILFILALILGGGGYLSLLKTATGFTIGHSITLALASLGWVKLPTRWVESAIALSIVYVACEAMFLKDSRNRWKIAMGFGLVHGFGFASALQELQLPRDRMIQALLGFNCGVELGQVLILALIVPLVLGMKNLSQQSVWVVRFSAASIAVIGSYWFIVRAFIL